MNAKELKELEKFKKGIKEFITPLIKESENDIDKGKNIDEILKKYTEWTIETIEEIGKTFTKDSKTNL